MSKTPQEAVQLLLDAVGRAEKVTARALQQPRLLAEERNFIEGRRDELALAREDYEQLLARGTALTRGDLAATVGRMKTSTLKTVADAFKLADDRAASRRTLGQLYNRMVLVLETERLLKEVRP